MIRQKGITKVIRNEEKKLLEKKLENMDTDNSIYMSGLNLKWSCIWIFVIPFFFIYIWRVYLLYAKINVWILGVTMAIMDNMSEIKLYSNNGAFVF